MYKCLPVAVYDSSVQLALADPLNQPMVDELGYLLRKEIVPVVADPKDIETAIGRYYGDVANRRGRAYQGVGQTTKTSRAKRRRPKRPGARRTWPIWPTKRPSSRFVSLVLSQAVARPGQRHSFRAVRGRIQNPLPRGRRALRNVAAAQDTWPCRSSPA